MRPSLTLTVIAKNEEKNIPTFFQSIKGCFDHIVFVDTGSTDKTIELAKEWAARIGAPILVPEFEWVKDFSKARNHALSFVKTDYAMWMDLDDSLGNPAAFIEWRDTAMEFGDYWIAKYHYALDPQGKPLIQFMRERVFKMSFKPQFNYFIHEGVKQAPGSRANAIYTWWIDHRRTQEEMVQDKGRNLAIMESHKADFDGRMWFYYGKELYENQKIDAALSALMTANTRTDIQPHDRMLAIQYACYCVLDVAEKLKPEFQGEKLLLCIHLAQQGLLIDATRAELHIIIGDCYIKQGRLKDAAPYFSAAKACIGVAHGGSHQAGALFTYAPCYQDIPRINLTKIYFHAGMLDDAEKEIDECLAKYPTDEARKIKDEIAAMKPLIYLEGAKEDVDDIVFTCPPQGAYEFDSVMYKNAGCGGSETALIEMATWLRKLTKRPVKVFNMRAHDMVDENGVEWISAQKLNAYMCAKKPRVNIAWRHNIKITNQPTYLWCHDLVTQGVDQVNNFDYIMCLSPFHRDYVKAMQGVNPDKMILTRNGIDPKKFDFVRPAKDPNKIVWLSSPDRGLDRCIKVMDEVREEFPDLTLHVYYGLENLYKYGLTDLANHLKQLMSERPWIKYHGFTEQKKMAKEIADAVVWLHPCDFIETFCITALETLILGIYPVTRALGGLKNTLAKAEADGNAVLLPHDCITPDEIAAYARATINVLREKKWENVKYDPDDVSWQSVAEEWLKFLPL